MKATELMIADYVSHEGEPYMIRQLGIYGEDRDGEDYPAVCIGKPKGVGLIVGRDEIKPIPLTTEILERNGWSYNDEDAKFAAGTWSGGGLILQQTDDGFMIVVTSDYDDEDTNHTPFILRYVHELQHALRLKHSDKEITL